MPWLTSCPAHRIAPTLTKFVRVEQPWAWTASDVVDHIDTVNRRAGWNSATRSSVRAPWGLLAAYLREADPIADHPRAGSIERGLRRDQERADARAASRAEHQHSDADTAAEQSVRASRAEALAELRRLFHGGS